MKRVLFVDDEPRVLEGLKRMLRPLRQEWVMEFAGGGREAVQRLSESHYDVLVTDLRMPEVDGFALLSEAIKISPQTVRIVLSSEADMGATVRSVALAHQYLVKPCDARTMQATVERALTLRSILDAPSLARLIGRVKSLPSLRRFTTSSWMRCDPTISPRRNLDHHCAGSGYDHQGAAVGKLTAFRVQPGNRYSGTSGDLSGHRYGAGTGDRRIGFLAIRAPEPSGLFPEELRDTVSRSPR